MLQGTLDVFSLDEVLGLLSGANKSGVLNVTGDRGVGAIALADGQLMSGSASCAPDATELHDVIFELLRFAEGSFSFDGNASVEGEPSDIETVLNAAHARLSEWLQIEAVVPSLDHHLALAETLATSQVTLNENEWAAVVAIGEGASVGVVAGRLGLGEFDGSKRVKSLIERDLVTITDRAPAAPPAPTIDPVADPVFETPAPAPASLDFAEDGPVADADIPAPDTGLRVTPVVESVFEPVTEPAPEPAAFAEDTVPPMPEAPAFADDEIPPMPDAPEIDGPEAPSFADDGIPPMPDAPEIDGPEAPSFADGEIPPMPEPPAPRIESAIAEEFATPPAASAENVADPDPETVGSFGGLDPISSVDMFEAPQRHGDRSPSEFAIADDIPPPPAPPAPAVEGDVPSFARPAFDPDDFAVNDEGADMAGDPFAAAEDAPVAVSDDEGSEDASEPEKGGSLLMRYLKSNH